MDYEEAKKNLVQLSGIGPKVRVLLLSNHLQLIAAKLFFLYMVLYVPLSVHILNRGKIYCECIAKCLANFKMLYWPFFFILNFDVSLC